MYEEINNRVRKAIHVFCHNCNIITEKKALGVSVTAEDAQHQTKRSSCKITNYCCSQKVNNLKMWLFMKMERKNYQQMWKPLYIYIYIYIHIIKQSPPTRLSVWLSLCSRKNSKTTARIFMRFSPIDRVILPENTDI